MAIDDDRLHDHDCPTTTPATTTSPPTATATTTEQRLSTTEMTLAYGTEIVSVSALDNQSRHAEWSGEQTVAFENLSDDRQEASLKALSEGEAVCPPNRNPFAFTEKSGQGSSIMTGSGTSCGSQSSEPGRSRSGSRGQPRAVALSFLRP